MSGRPTHPLETWTREAFGSDFAGIVLHGLLDGEEAEQDLIDVAGVDWTGRERRKTLAVKRPRPEPWGLKPLVLAALLKLLVEKQKPEISLEYSFPELLIMLGWDDVPASRRTVEDAVTFYLDCKYSTAAVHEKGAGQDESRDCFTFLSGYTLGVDDIPQCDCFADEGHAVTFTPQLVDGLRRGRAVFAGTDFGELRRVDVASGPGRKSPWGGVNGDAAADLSFRPPGPRPVLTINPTTVSQRPADFRWGMGARSVGETAVIIDTGALTDMILRALNRDAAKHRPSHPCPPESVEAIAWYVCREVERRMVEGARTLVWEVVREGVYKDALYQSYGLTHSKPPEAQAGVPGPRPVWYSPDHLLNSLTRAIEAIEFDNWRPKRGRVKANRRWKVSNIKTATIKMVAAYWDQKEGNDLGAVDSGRMSKWLKSFGLPSYKQVRSILRQKIARRRRDEAALRRFGGNVWAFMLFGDLDEDLVCVRMPS